MWDYGNTLRFDASVKNGVKFVKAPHLKRGNENKIKNDNVLAVNFKFYNNNYYINGVGGRLP